MTYLTSGIAVPLVFVSGIAFGQTSPLADRARRGEVSNKDVRLAAHLGDFEAIAICGSLLVTNSKWDTRFDLWMGDFQLHGRGAVIRAHIAMVNSSLSFWTDAHPADDRLVSALHALEAHKANAPVAVSLRDHLATLEAMWRTLTMLAAGKGVEHWRDIYVLERLISALRWTLNVDVHWQGATGLARPLSDDAARRAVVADMLPFARREGDPIRARVAARAAGQ